MGRPFQIAVATLALLASATAFVSSAGPAAHAARAAAAPAVAMRSGNQIGFRQKRVRWNNQRKDPERLRLNVFRSHQHIYAQVINDDESRTVVSASSLDPAVKDAGDETKGQNKLGATAVGKLLAERMKEAGLNKLYFDRFSATHKYKYHGRIAALVDGVREGGVVV